jgi:ABC-type multidrug transport system fused ATPase/permease subunit
VIDIVERDLRLWELIKLNKLPWLSGICALTIYQLLTLALPYLLKLFIDHAIAAKDIAMLWWLGGAGVALFGLSSIARYFGRLAASKAAEQFCLDLRKRVVHHLQGLSLSYHRSRKLGDMVARVQWDTYALKQFVGNTIPAVVELVVGMVGTAVILLVLAPKLFLLTFAAIPAAILIGYMYRNKIQPLSRKLSAARGKLNSTAHEALSCVEEVKLYDASHEFERRLGEHAALEAETEIELARHQSKLFPLLNFAISFVLLGVLVAGGHMAIAGTLTVGTLVAYYYYVSRALAPIRSASGLVIAWQRTQGAYERLEELLASDERLFESDTPTVLEDGELRVDVQEVTFTYRSSTTGEEFTALDGVSFSLGPQDRLVLLGPSGAGKSTTGKLIPRLFDPNQGDVAVNGVSLRELDLDAWRMKIGYVGQEVLLFDGTIEENIVFGAPGEVSDVQLQRVVKAARVDDVIANKEQGLQTPVAEKGAKLSGGQKKRIALARALIREPAILVIDQLAADLQEGLCRDIFENIRRDFDVSILYLGHRVPAGFEPDKVFWMEDGRIKRRLTPATDEDQLTTTGT